FMVPELVKALDQTFQGIVQIYSGKFPSRYLLVKGDPSFRFLFEKENRRVLQLIPEKEGKRIFLELSNLLERPALQPAALAVELMMQNGFVFTPTGWRGLYRILSPGIQDEARVLNEILQLYAGQRSE